MTVIIPNTGCTVPGVPALDIDNASPNVTVDQKYNSNYRTGTLDTDFEGFPEI